MSTNANKPGDAPAFPHDTQELGDKHRVAQPGMTLRQWFAGLAMQGELANSTQECGYWSEDIFPVLVRRCYKLADLMVAGDVDASPTAEPAPPPPLFEVGKCYKNRRGEVVGPLWANTGPYSDTHPLRSTYYSYTLAGIVSVNGRTNDCDLVPGELPPPPTWVPWPWLPDGEYRTYGESPFWLINIDPNIGEFTCAWARRLRGYTSDPPAGCWRIKDGKATWAPLLDE